MKTAVQEVFSDLEKLHPQLFNVYTTEGKEFINHFHKYLELEREQTEYFFKQGWIYSGCPFEFEKRYLKTFKPEL